MPSNTAHTPGPWYCGYGKKVVAVYMKPLSDGWLVRDQIARFDRDAEGEANARLIAAAPDMLGALRKALRDAREAMPATEREAFDHGGRGPEWMATVRDAIARATEA